MERYTYKDKFYILERVVQTKHPETREWFTCVLYMQEESALWFVREFHEFFEIFKKV